MGLARAVLTRCMPSGAFACRGAGGGRGRTERDGLQRRRGQENAGSAPSPRHGWHPDLPVRHARAPFESMPSVVGRTQSAVDEREFDLCGRKQGGSDLGQLALQRLLLGARPRLRLRRASASLGQPRPTSRFGRFGRFGRGPSQLVSTYGSAQSPTHRSLASVPTRVRARVSVRSTKQCW